MPQLINLITSFFKFVLQFITLNYYKNTMSWGATAFTPIIMYNEPPFGYDEGQNPPDFPRCISNPYKNDFILKDQLDRLFKQRETRENRQLLQSGKASNVSKVGNVTLIEPFLGGMIKNVADKEICLKIKNLLWIILAIFIVINYI
jgi:hypothetical protein